MRRKTGVKPLVALALGGCAWVGVILAQGALANLGVNEATATRVVERWLDSGYLNVSAAAKSFKAAVPTGRVALVKGAMGWATTLIARRLQEFLDVSKDVDFEAKLVPAGSKMRFADPQYEEELPEWKLYDRSGRDAVAAAREVAQVWLKAL